MFVVFVNLDVLLCVGDHFYTAAAIARDCDILAKDSLLYLIDSTTTTADDGTVTTKPLIVDLSNDVEVLDMSVAELVELCRISKVESTKMETKFLSNKDLVSQHSSNVSLSSGK